MIINVASKDSGRYKYRHDGTTNLTHSLCPWIFDDGKKPNLFSFLKKNIKVS
jgi:hypothetical protein